MTCRAPKTNICGAGSTLSEYELYFNYAREKFPGNLVSSNQFYLYCPTCPTLRVPFLSCLFYSFSESGLSRLHVSFFSFSYSCYNYQYYSLNITQPPSVTLHLLFFSLHFPLPEMILFSSALSIFLLTSPIFSHWFFFSSLFFSQLLFLISYFLISLLLPSSMSYPQL